MNDYLSDPLDWDDSREYDRGKVLDADALDKLDNFGRYLDVDGDAITWRTLPGTHPEKGAFFTRGTSRDEYAVYTEKGDAYEKNMQRLLTKWHSAPQYLPAPLINDSGQRHGVIHFGTSAAAVDEAMDLLDASGIALDSLRVRSVPFHDEVMQFINNHDIVFVVEQNRDAQMRTVLIKELECTPAKLVAVLHYNGSPLPAKVVEQHIRRVVESAGQDSAAVTTA